MGQGVNRACGASLRRELLSNSHGQFAQVSIDVTDMFQDPIGLGQSRTMQPTGCKLLILNEYQFLSPNILRMGDPKGPPLQRLDPLHFDIQKKGKLDHRRIGADLGFMDSTSTFRDQRVNLRSIVLSIYP